MIEKIAMFFIAFLGVYGPVYAEKFPIVGATYQLDRAQFPDKVAVCYTADAMTKYMEAKLVDDQAAIQKMVFKVATMDDMAIMKKLNGCTLISTFTQAKIIKKGVESHQAEFFAFPLEPMWGYYLYFGGRVR
ncbi:MAG: hypothetical protein NPIRA03_41690 [Nitrospirales bacterium]|nr:MAG: hypothetical protein NPIRA03_41690 [Nitrospirales bacterium]